MTDGRARQIVADGFCARLGTTGADGWPYVVPMLYVYADGQIYVHNSRPRGHFRNNVDRGEDPVLRGADAQVRRSGVGPSHALLPAPR